MIPQIIWMALFCTNLVAAGYRHGKEKTGKYNAYVSITVMLIGASLLWWGGFFDPILK